MKTNYCLLLLLIYNFCYSQNSTDEERKFNDVINSIIFNKKGLSAEKVIFIGDSLYANSINDRQRVRSLFVITNGYMNINRSEALKYALKADSIADKNNMDLVCRTSGLVASQYRYLGLYEESIRYLKKAQNSADALQGSDYYNTKLLILNELGTIYFFQKRMKEMLDAYNQELDLIQELNKKHPDKDAKVQYSVFSGIAYLNIGYLHYEKNELEKAKSYINKAEKEFDNANNPPSEMANIRIMNAKIEIKLKNSNNALKYLNNAKVLVDKLKDKDLNNRLDNAFDEYYSSIKNHTKSDSIKGLIIDYADYRNNTISKSSQDIIKKEQEKVGNQKRISTTFVLLSSALVILLISTFLYFKRRSIKSKQKFDRIIVGLRERNIQNLPSMKSEHNTSLPSGKIISDKTEQELLNKLKDFESENLYTSKDFSVSNLTTILGTNTKYLSFILKKHKGKKFNDYINELRIKFIVNELYNNPQYLNYKINYLAEVCGFSSHSRFGYIFKNELGISPSEFISRLRKEKQKKH